MTAYVGEYVDNAGQVEREVINELEAREYLSSLGVPLDGEVDDAVLGDVWVEW